MPVRIPVPRVRIGRTLRPHPVLLPRGVGLSGLGAVQILPASTVQTIANTIVTQEGYNAALAPNNNPGNLIYAGQSGASPGAGGFAQFSSYQAGLDALENQVQLYAARGMTISDMMAVYAPAGQGSNNPTLYASKVAGALGVSPDTSLLDLAAGSSVDASAAPTDVYTDSGTVSLDSLLGGSAADPVLLSVGAGVLALALYTFLGE